MYADTILCLFLYSTKIPTLLLYMVNGKAINLKNIILMFFQLVTSIYLSFYNVIISQYHYQLDYLNERRMKRIPQININLSCNLNLYAWNLCIISYFILAYILITECFVKTPPVPWYKYICVVLHNTNIKKFILST